MRVVRKHARAARGFTLIEAALTTVIIGVAFVGMLQLLAAGTVSNIRGTELTTAVNLARNIRENALRYQFAQIPALDGESFSPPIDSRGVGISQLEGWEQRIRVQPVDPDRLTVSITTPYPEALRVTVTILRNKQQVCELSWFCFDATP
jgi:type II secretory pathway pseudopilin PulG